MRTVSADAPGKSCVMSFALGAKLVWDEYRFEVTSPGLGEPQWIYTLTLPVLSLLVMLRAIDWWRRARKLPHAADQAPPPGAEI